MILSLNCDEDDEDDQWSQWWYDDAIMKLVALWMPLMLTQGVWKEGNGWDGSLFNHMQMVLVVAAVVIISTITNDDLEQEDFDDWLTLVAHSTSVETKEGKMFI